MTVEEIIEEIDNEFQKENGYWLSTAIPIEFAAQVAIKFAKLKCQEQRQICADNANTYSDMGGYTFVDKNSILNAPAPEI